MIEAFIILAVLYVMTTVGFIFTVYWITSYFGALAVRIETERRDQSIRDKQERETLMRERNTLLERIQRPEFTPTSPLPGPMPDPEVVHDELHLVGTIAHPDPNVTSESDN